MVDVMGRPFKPCDPDVGEEWESPYVWECNECGEPVIDHECYCTRKPLDCECGGYRFHTEHCTKRLRLVSKYQY